MTTMDIGVYRRGSDSHGLSFFFRSETFTTPQKPWIRENLWINISNDVLILFLNLVLILILVMHTNLKRIKLGCDGKSLGYGYTKS